LEVAATSAETALSPLAVWFVNCGVRFARKPTCYTSNRKVDKRADELFNQLLPSDVSSSGVRDLDIDEMRAVMVLSSTWAIEED